MQNRKIILVTEDEKTLRNALHFKLTSEGFGVLEAKDGIEGLDIALKERPDLILLDIVMPKMDGMTMLEKLRADSWGNTVPVIILTNLTSDDDVRNEAITKLEPTYYFVKTDKSIEEIIDKIKERLNI